jgi:prepilin-type N-terminal cleavage/methylation domain-containing protein/prepilin-type processing-associated H-X9-DG protein
MPVRQGVTLIELLVVVTIIAILVALLFPALSGARAAARRAACQSNLKQFAVGLLAHADRHGTYCSGAFDWRHDGCVTETGWVADLVNTGTLVGEMLCPAHPAQISETYNDLLGMDVDPLPACVDEEALKGSPEAAAPDGSPIINPCRQIVEDDPGLAARTDLVLRRVYMKSYNTNYTASWFLVRSAVSLEDDGSLRGGACASLKSLDSTIGPLEPARVDTGNVAAGLVPLLGCGGSAAGLSSSIGPHRVGEPTTKSFTNGPVDKLTMATPSCTDADPKVWRACWENTLQDYRGFATVHQGGCNVLFADGSVRTLWEGTGAQDGLLNNGFPAMQGFNSSRVEVTEQDIFSKWSLRAID